MQALLSDAVAAAGADFGNIQLFDPAKRTLRLAVNEGFDEEFLQFFEVVRGSDTACGAAMEARSRVIVQNVSSSSIYAEDSRRALLRAKVRALQSTPIIGVQDQFLGVLSTHFRNPGRPDRLALQQVDRLIREFLDAGSLVSGSSSDVDIRFKRERG